MKTYFLKVPLCKTSAIGHQRIAGGAEQKVLRYIAG